MLYRRSHNILRTSHGIRLVSSTKDCLDQLRLDDGYQEFITMVTEFCGNHSIEIPNFEEIYIM
jgi:hypothetical protein